MLHNELKKERLRKTYPYLATRIRVKKRDLLKKEDYEKMLKMGFNEIANFLKERKLSSEINEYALNYKGRELLELAINKHFANTLFQISEMSKTRNISLVDVFIEKWELYNIKIMFRGIANSLEFDEIKYALIPLNPLDFYKDLYENKKELILNEISSFIDVPVDKINKAIEEKDLAPVENKIDKKYYTKAHETFQEAGIKTTEKELRSIYGVYIDLLNIKTTARALKERIKSSAFEELLILPERRFSKTLLKVKSIDDLIEAVNKSIYKKEISDIVKKLKESNSLASFEYELDLYIYKRVSKLMKYNPLSLSVIFGFLLMKESEMKNLKLLVNSKFLNMDEEFIRENLLV